MPIATDRRRFVLVIEKWRPTKLNDLLEAHWAVAARMKKIDRNMVCGYCLYNRIPIATGKRRVNLTIVRQESEPGPNADPDAYWKSTLDALVKAKMLIDDKGEYCEPGLVTFERAATAETRIELLDL